MNSRALAVQLAMLGLAFLGLAAFEALTRPAISRAEFGLYGTYATPLLFAILGSFVLLIAGIVAGQIPAEARPRVETPAVAAQPPLRHDSKTAQTEAPLQLHPFNEVAFKHYLAGLKAPAKDRKVKITDAVAAIAEGRNPAVLAEFLAAQLAIASSDDPEANLETRLPHFGKPVSFRHRSIKGLAFLFEGKAFVVLAGRENETLRNRVRETTALRTGRTQNLPSEAVWEAAPRHRGFAEDWDALREAVETWVNDVAFKSDPECAYIFSGYAQGGAVAILAAYEFVKRGRKVAGVVTFGAPPPGGQEFAVEYDRLGLDDRTLRLEFDGAAPASTLLPLLYVPVGRLWRFEQPCLSSRDPPAPQHEARRWRTAYAANSLQRRYGLVLSTLVYQRLRELIGASGTAPDYEAAYEALLDHMAYIRGAKSDSAAGVFSAGKDLPLKVKDAADLAALEAAYPQYLI